MNATDNYASRLLLEFRGYKQPELEAGSIVWRFYDGVREKLALGGPESLSPQEQQLMLLGLYVRNIVGIHDRLQINSTMVSTMAIFAQERGLPKTATVLAQVLREFTSGAITDNKHWGQVDLQLTGLAIQGESIKQAIIDYVAENLTSIQLPVPGSVQEADARAARIDALAAAQSAPELLCQLLDHRQAHVLAWPMAGSRRDTEAEPLVVKVHHRANPPAETGQITQLRLHYGPMASELLDLYALHDGAGLFYETRRPFPALHLSPIGEWPENLDIVEEWLHDVEEDEGEPTPEFVRDAIPFCHIDGNSSEYWMLITQGKFAGAIMRSQAEVLEERVAYPSLRHFFATLILYPRQQLGYGGYISYEGYDGRGCYPFEYVFEDSPE